MVKRAETKAILKEKILKAARDVFMNDGYESATIGKISEIAGVGIGTAYNFFKSKEEIFLLSMAEELISEDSENATVNQALESPSDVISSMIIANVKRLNFFSKKIWRVAMAAVFSSLKANNLPIQALMKADYRFMDKIEDRLETFKKDGRLKEDFSTKTAVELIYGSLMTNLMAYIYSEKTTIDETFNKIETGIRFVLKQ